MSANIHSFVYYIGHIARFMTGFIRPKLTLTFYPLTILYRLCANVLALVTMSFHNCTTGKFEV